MSDHHPTARPWPHRGSAGLRVGLAVVLAVGLVGVVAVLAAGSSADETVGLPHVTIGVLWLNLAIVVFGTGALVVVGALVFGIATGGDGQASAPGLLRQIPGMLLIGAFLWLLFTLWRPPDDRAEDVGEGAPPPPTETRPNDEESDAFDLGPFIAGAIAIVGAAGVLRWATTRGDEMAAETERPEEVVEQRRAVLVGLLDEALARLRQHPDPRHAVITCWANLEDALGSVGVPRHLADTPTQYMARILESVDTSAAAVEQLTSAFERAMFSPDQIDRATQHQAVDAVVAVRDELHLMNHSALHSPASRRDTS